MYVGRSGAATYIEVRLEGGGRDEKPSQNVSLLNKL